ncbi:MAG: hypothetical protein II453_04195 [Alphaproteobacteria bacterium]|nr:hypothetical protein [Alphaproteobacteria bacterium]
MDLREILKEAYKELFELRPVSCGGHLLPLFPKVDVIREPGETVVFKSENNQSFTG